MRANEYFKKHGYKHCKSACVQNGWLNTGFWVHLKRLAGSWKLVNFYGGIQNAKEIVKISVRSGYRPSSLSDINQAIADVESCQ